MLYCDYKHIFGKPKEGIHKYRLYDFAIVDIILTIILAIIISKKYKINFIITLFIVFIIGIFFHYIFCVDTTIHKMIFLSRSQSRSY